MAVEQVAIVVGILGLMIFLLEFASRINLETSGRGIIDLNTIAKTVFVFMSFVVGIGLTIVLYAMAAETLTWLPDILLILMQFWIFMTCFLLLFFLFYYLVYIPKLFYKMKKDE
jgi:hypothetical protein